MTKTTDFTKMFQDMMGNMPMDMTLFENAFKSQAAMNEKLAKVALEAVENTVEVSTKWTKDTLAKVGDITAAKKDPADYSKAMTEFASAQADLMAENLAAFAEIAKKMQNETVELMLSASKDMGAEATAAVKKATDEVTKAAKKATQTAK
ncbi:MAG: Phasin [Alphaproteobacteria bacterium]|nr:MAG: Phasin [Alphaproteobacteria bacterium]